MDSEEPFSHVRAGFLENRSCERQKSVVAVVAMAYFIAFSVFIDFDARPAMVAG